jgi:DedD protein
MEKKKLLLVAVSVGLFLVIVIGAAIVVLSKQDADPSLIVRETYAPGMSGTLPPQTSSISESTGMYPNANTVNAGNTDLANNSANPVDINQPSSVDTITMLNNPEIQILKPAPEEKSPDSINHFYGDTNTIYSSDVKIEKYTPEAVAARSAEPIKVPAVTAPVSTPRAADVPPPSTQVTKVPTSVQTPKPVPAKVYDDYWVQTGSFSTKVRADNVKESLGTKGISSVIEVRNVSDRTWYRVRVGPYVSQEEAEYWLSLIQSIDGFEESQIWQSQSTR